MCRDLNFRKPNIFIIRPIELKNLSVFFVFQAVPILRRSLLIYMKKEREDQNEKMYDLNSVKEVAGCLLYTDVHKVENYSFIVKHPFTDYAFATIAKNPDKVTDNAVINILESESNLNRWREYVAERIDSAESTDEIYCRITKPYRLTFMKYAGQYLSEKDFAEMLCSAWITSENPNSDANVSQSELLRMFRSADKSLLMTAEERKWLNEIDNPVTVYRGVTPYNAKSVKAMSWTLDYEKALWFAKRFDSDGTVYTAEIEKSHILALFDGRDESEIVVEPAYLLNIEEYEEENIGFLLT